MSTSTAERERAGASVPTRVSVVHVDGDAYSIGVRGHVILVDQPIPDGGEDYGPTPTELFAASLAACVAFYAGRYLQRHGLDRTGLAVAAEFSMASDHPARVADVRLRISVPAGLPPERANALLAVASHCTVHNSLRYTPDISIELRDLPEDIMDSFGKLFAAGPMFFASAWLLMLFAGAVSADIGVRPFGYLTSMVVTIGLWLTLAPAIGAIARTSGSGKREK